MSRRKASDEAAEVSITRHQRLHDGFRPIDAFEFSHRKDGQAAWEEPVTREVLRSPGIVAVLPYDPVAGQLVLLHQFRFGAHLATGKGMLVEVVAGAVDHGEDAEAAARRELKEETGLAARRLMEIARFLSSPGISDEFITLFLADVDASGLNERAGHDAGEVIHPFACSPEEAIMAADAGGITNAFTLLALNWFDRHKGDVRTMLREKEE